MSGFGFIKIERRRSFDHFRRRRFHNSKILRDPITLENWIACPFFEPTFKRSFAQKMEEFGFVQIVMIIAIWQLLALLVS